MASRPDTDQQSADDPHGERPSARQRVSRARGRLGRALYLFPWLTLLLILALTVLAWWIGVRTTDPPTKLHSLGVVVQAINPDKRIGDRTRGEDLPAGPCRRCVKKADLIRYGAGAGLRVDMVVQVHPHLGLFQPECGQAMVDMVISAPRPFWAQHYRLGQTLGPDGQIRPSPLTVFAIGWDRTTRITAPSDAPQPPGVPALVAFYQDEQAALHPGFYTDADLTGGIDAHHTKVSGYPLKAPFAVKTQLYNWNSYYAPDKHHRLERYHHRWALQLHFLANWVQPRGWGSCYILIPSLLANGAFAGTQDAIKALEPSADIPTQTNLLAEAQPPSNGRIALAVDGAFSLADTSPAPTDFEAIFVAGNGTPHQHASQLALYSRGHLGPVWSCRPSDNLAYLTAHAAAGIPHAGSFSGDACGSVAVVYAAGASDFRAVFLIVVGVLIALAFERFFRRLSSNEPEWPMKLMARVARRARAAARRTVP